MNEDQAKPAQYLISTVSKRSGVKTDLIRAWERRYEAVTPSRTAGRQRVYTDQDIARLKLLNQAISNGHSIGRIARLSLDELQSLLKRDTHAAKQPIGVVTPIRANNRDLAEEYLEKCFSAIIAFEAAVLEGHCENAIAELGPMPFIEHLLTPLLNKIGESWQAGLLRPAHEHMATAIIRSLAYILRSSAPSPKQAPRLIMSTPLGQLHEIGALLATIIAEFKGWHVTYLGPNLPAEEIAAAVKYARACAVAVSISFRTDDHVINREIRRLNKLIGKDVALIAGGRATSDYQAVLDEVGALSVQNYEHFKLILDRLRIQTSLHDYS
ncbi:MerR family transcriptional regulator [Methylobacter sp. sgz302048]|uniref:MerR family transcriptional regulator n=1 Tax=Methylobacter sp. sgz302048 TaxID=3455945 RepID=UPI003FA16BB6